MSVNYFFNFHWLTNWWDFEETIQFTRHNAVSISLVFRFIFSVNFRCSYKVKHSWYTDILVKLTNFENILLYKCNIDDVPMMEHLFHDWNTFEDVWHVFKELYENNWNFEHLDLANSLCWCLLFTLIIFSVVILNFKIYLSINVQSACY